MFPATADARRNLLTAALRAVRRRRRMSLIETARAMGMPRRSYQHFESGGGRLNLELMLRFATATDSDPIALFAAVLLASPAFASSCADSKVATILFLALDAIHDETREARADLDADALWASVRDLLDVPSRLGALNDPQTAEWRAKRLDQIAARTRRFEDPPG